jgi:hypothetical protein
MKTRVAACALSAALLMSCQSATPPDGTGPGAPPQVGLPMLPSANASSVSAGATGVNVRLPSAGNAAPAASSVGGAPMMTSASMAATGAAGAAAAAQPDGVDAELDMLMPARNSWMGFGGGYEQTFARPSAAIEKSNLAMIGEAWKKMAPGGVTGTPAIFGGVVYWADWVGNVHADKITDGSELWMKTYKRGFTSSPFVTDDGVYLSNRDNMV